MSNDGDTMPYMLSPDWDGFPIKQLRSRRSGVTKAILFLLICLALFENVMHGPSWIYLPNEYKDAKEKVPIVGRFNNQEIVFRDPSTFADGFSSSMSCIGETFQRDADDRWPAPWLFRSCQFKNLCFDTDQKDFILIRSKADQEFDEAFSNVKNNSLHTVSTSFVSNTLGGGVAIGPISNRWDLESKKRLKWFPRIVDAAEIEKELAETGYYELAGDSTVMVPYHDMKGTNLGHLIWDAYLPVFHTLRLFDLVPEQSDNSHPIFLLRHVVPGEGRAICDDPDHRPTCQVLYNKTLPLMGIPPNRLRTSVDSLLALDDNSAPRSRYVCSQKGVAGMGLLSDHGLKLHGEWISDYENFHNYGRGNTLFEFRNFMMKNMGFDTSARRPTNPIKVVFSVHSSSRGGRNFDFLDQLASVEKMLRQEKTFATVQVETYKLSDCSLKEQLSILSQASILVTASGGGASTSLFLPPGASLIIFYDDNSPKYGYKEITPVQRLDFDYFNSLGYIRSHWLPTSSMKQDIDIFTMLMEKELRSVMEE